MSAFSLQALDHVALRCMDVERSAAWYQKILGLKRDDIPEWKPYPVFLMAEGFGVALFPATDGPSPEQLKPRMVQIDHYAFRVDRQSFEAALDHYDQLGLVYQVQDHTYFHSVYTKDPDGHTVELTTLAVPEADFEQFNPDK